MNPSTSIGKIRLCPLTAIPVGGATGFRLETNSGMRDILVVRLDDHYYAYLNSCPHTGASLDWQPNQFLDSSGTLIQCSTHGALFRIEDGLCIYGPCLNRALTPLMTQIEDGELFILLRSPVTTNS